MEWATLFLMAFGGGAFGALFGGTTIFIIMGFFILAGSGIALAGGGDAFLLNVAFGTTFAPHISFVGGVVAAAFYGRHRTVLSHEEEFVESTGAFSGADTITPLFKMKDISTLFVGGIFGMVGLALVTLFTNLHLPLDPSALTVATTGIIARLVFGKAGLLGKYPTEEKRYDLSPKHLAFTAFWGAVLAIVSYQVATVTQIDVVMFGFSALSLIVLYFGLEIPVTHHITLISGLAALTFQNIWLTILFGILATFLGNFYQRTFNTHVDSHLDNAALTIATCSLIIGLIA